MQMYIGIVATRRKNIASISCVNHCFERPAPTKKRGEFTADF